ncbi:MAG: hypothetical protein ACLRW7_20155 [Phocaeicola vulgatus]
MGARQGSTTEKCISYGICSLHLERQGADGAMSTHIERTVHRKNADRMRTHLNRELVRFLKDKNRTQAIAYRTESGHQTQGGHQPGEGNPGAAHRKQQGHEANGRGREA